MYVFINMAGKRKQNYKSNSRKRFKFAPRKKFVKGRKTFTKKKFIRSVSLQGKPKKVGTGHWLSFAPKGMNVGQQFNSKFVKGWEKANAPNFNATSYAGAISIAAGSQTMQTLSGAYTPYDIGVYNGTNGEGRSILESCSWKITFTNQANAPVFLELYDIVARHDIHLAQNLIYDPATAVNTQITNTDFGVTPFLSPYFTENYKVLRVTRINLALGETCEHLTHLAPNMVFKDWMSVYQVASGTVEADGTGTDNPGVDNCAVAKLTRYCLAVARGAPCDADNITVGPSAGQIDFIVEKQYRWTTLTNIANSTHFTATVSSAGTHIMDTGTGTDVTIAKA